MTDGVVKEISNKQHPVNVRGKNGSLREEGGRLQKEKNSDAEWSKMAVKFGGREAKLKILEVLRRKQKGGTLFEGAKKKSAERPQRGEGKDCVLCLQTKRKKLGGGIGGQETWFVLKKRLLEADWWKKILRRKPHRPLHPRERRVTQGNIDPVELVMVQQEKD